VTVLTRHARAPDAEVAALVHESRHCHQNVDVAANKPTRGNARNDGDGPATRPRPWPHDRDQCSTCVVFAMLSDRRRRQEIDVLREVSRVIDLRDEFDVAWVEAHVRGHELWEANR
jgi:hypothetical protein